MRAIPAAGGDNVPLLPMMKDMSNVKVSGVDACLFISDSQLNYITAKEKADRSREGVNPEYRWSRPIARPLHL